MQRISRAPELSATLRRVSCWIIASPALPGPLQHLEQPPALQARGGARLDHPDDIALLGGVGLVVGADLAGAAHHLLVGGVPADHGDLHRDRLVGRRRDHLPLTDLLRPRLARRGRRSGARLATLGATPRPVPAATLPGAAATLGALARSLLDRALRARRSGGARALPLPELLRTENLSAGGLAFGYVSGGFGLRLLGGVRLGGLLRGLRLGRLLRRLVLLVLLFLGHQGLRSFSARCRDRCPAGGRS